MRKDRQGDDDTDAGHFKDQKRSNDTHESTTDSDARLYRKGKTASELRFMGHTLTDNRHALVVSAVVTQADGYAEREAAKAMINDARPDLPRSPRQCWFWLSGLELIHTFREKSLKNSQKNH